MLLEITLHTLSAVLAFLVMVLLLNLLLNIKKKFFPILLSLIICLAFTYISVSNEWAIVGRTFITMFILVVFAFNGTLPNKIMSAVLLIQLGIVLDFIHGIAMMMSIQIGYTFFIEIFVSLILLIFNHVFKDKKPLIQYFDKKYVLIWILVTLNFILFSAIVSSLEFSSQMKGLISTILILTSGINLYFCYYLEKTRKIFEENIVISKQAEFQESKLEQNKAYLEKNNRLMHDIKRHYLEIEQALSENQLDYVKEYMKGVYQQYFDNSGTGFTGNQVVDSMFFSLKEQCQKEKIELDCSISITKRIELDEKDLAVILGGLFDKAVKMASQIEQASSIKVGMKTDQHHLVITVQHPKELKGTGTKSMIQQWEESQMIHRIVEKYHGMYEIVEEPELSGTKIILPISLKNKNNGAGT